MPFIIIQALVIQRYQRVPQQQCAVIVTPRSMNASNDTVWIDSASGMPAINRVTLFLFVVT
jgi:hypothetical protein